MVDSLESFDEHLFCHRDVVERDRAVLEESVGCLAVYYFVHEVGDTFLRVFAK